MIAGCLLNDPQPWQPLTFGVASKLFWIFFPNLMNCFQLVDHYVMTWKAPTATTKTFGLLPPSPKSKSATRPMSHRQKNKRKKFFWGKSRSRWKSFCSFTMIKSVLNEFVMHRVERGHGHRYHLTGCFTLTTRN